MKNIHVLPTDKPSRLVKNNLGLIRVTDDFTQKDLDFIKAEFVNIYITSDEKIKDVRPHKGKLVIMTTDQDLIKDGVQAIDDEFLEWFVKNPSCEWVEIVDDWNSPSIDAYEYKIIIPKEETKKNLKKIMYVNRNL